MRVVVLDDIYNKNSEFEAMGDQLFIHGGNDEPYDIVADGASHGLEIVRYHTGFIFDKEDIVYFCDRTLNHFYDGWKMLRKSGMLGRTIAVLVESDVVDRKCGLNVLRRIRNAFPFFMTYQDDIIDDRKYFKIWTAISCTDSVREKEIPWDELGLAALISTKQVISENPGEKYSERIRIADWFEEHPEYSFHVYGRNWDGYRNYGGIIHDKTEAYDKVRFAFCIENCRRNGYITEKIFDCFTCGTVPVYLGAPNVSKYIPENCYIDYDAFDTIDDLVKYLSDMTKEDYDRYLCNIKEFLSGCGDRFSRSTQFDSVTKISRLMKEGFSPSLFGRLSMFTDIWVYERKIYYRKILALKRNSSNA